MAQEQQDQVQVATETVSDEVRDSFTPSEASEPTVAPTIVEGTADTEVSATPTLKKRVKRKGKWVNVEDVVARPSFWPLLLAFSLALFCLGFISLPFIAWIGIALLIVSAIGWLVERR